MAQTLKNIGIWADGVDFAGVSNSVTLDLTNAVQDTPNFASAWMNRVGGLNDSSMSLEGYVDSTFDEQLFDALGTTDSYMLVPAGKDPGDLAYIVPVSSTSHSIGGAVGEVFGYSMAGQGDGTPFRAQVMDIREGITANVDQDRQNFGAIPVGQTRKIVIHVKHNSGRVRVDLMSATAETGGTLTQRTQTANITTTGLYELTVASTAIAPVTDEWWFLRYIVGPGSNDVDVAAASLQGLHSVVVPATPVAPPTPTPGTVSVRGGVSADQIPTAIEFTIEGVNHVLSFDAFNNLYLLLARLSSEADIASVVLGSDPTAANQIGAFTKHGSTVTISGEDYNVWLSNNALTFPAADTVHIA